MSIAAVIELFTKKVLLGGLNLTGGDREYTVLRTFLICLTHGVIGKILN